MLCQLKIWYGLWMRVESKYTVTSLTLCEVALSLFKVL